MIPPPLGASDVIVVGDGIVGLSIAHALASRGISAHVIGERLPGAASIAAAGLLSPSGGTLPESVRAFMTAARDAYPSFVTRLEHDTGRTIPLNRLGILEIALDDDELADLVKSAPAGTDLLSQTELARDEPSLAHARGALLHPNDGFVDNRAVVEALDEWVARSTLVRRSTALVRSVELDRSAAVVTASGDRFACDTVVLAAGAWTRAISGIPRELPVFPLRGQMLAVDGQPLRHAVMGTPGYLVPRRGCAFVGSTLEPGSFDSQPTSADIEDLRARLRQLCPALGDAAERARWAGVRPATPDMRPIIDRESRAESLIYACGHSKNGILLAPLTGDCVADLITKGSSRIDLRAFAASRFDAHLKAERANL